MRLAPLVFAFVAGTVASANPCGFALLPAAFLSYTASGEGSGGGAAGRIAQALLSGAAMTLAFALVFGLVGAGLAAGLGVLMPAMPWATIVVGSILAVLGVFVLSGRHISLPLPSPLSAAGSGYRGPFLFGVGYAVASLSCTLPVFLSVVGASAGGISFVVRSGMFVAYAVGMGTILTSLALGAALARGGLHRILRRAVRHISRVSGLFLLAAGLYLIYYWAFFLLPGSERRTAGKGPIEALNHLAERLQNWFAFGSGAWVASVLLAFIVIVAALAAWWILRMHGGATRGAGHQAPRAGSERGEAAERGGVAGRG